MLACSHPRQRAAALLAVIVAGVAASHEFIAARAAPAGGNAGGLSLDQYMQRVVEYNESIQARLLAFHAARSQRRAENGTFEPALVATGGYVDRSRPNTIEIERSLRSGGVFDERNQTYGSAIEMQTPFGTRLRFGATAGELINNIQRTVIADLDAEYQTQVGITIEQPLLRGGGPAANLAALRLAARGSEIAYQEYRRQLMGVVAEAELAYWQLYYAQQEEQLGAESVALAQTLVRDTQAALEAGRGSRLDVLEAEAGLALRRSREMLSRQRRLEAANRLAGFLGGGADREAPPVVAVEGPVLRPVTVEPVEGGRVAMAMNPDLLRAMSQVEQEMVRVAYNRNQRLPELDLKTSYGASGLGFDWTSSWRDIEKNNFPDWTLGLELRLPIWGGVRGRHEYRAARLRLVQAQRAAAEISTQLRTGMDSVMSRVETTFTAAQSYGAVVDFRDNLLRARLQGREVGRIDSRSVLEAEQELFVARLEELQSAIEYQRALLDLQVISGSLLVTRGLEQDFEELETRTDRWSKDPNDALPALRYRAPTFTHWPTEAGVPFMGEPDPSHPWRLRLTRKLPWQANGGCAQA